MTELNTNTFQIELLRNSEGQYFNVPPEFEFLTDNVLVHQRQSTDLLACH